MKLIKEALERLKEVNELEPVKNKSLVSADDLNAKLLKKIEIISDALQKAFEQEGINLDAKLVAQDIIRDCGLMGGLRGTDELDAENNPFDAATKEMHDIGPVDTDRACQMLLNVQPHEFVSVFMRGLRDGRGLLPGPGGRRALPHGPAPRMIGRRGFREEIETKDYSYILDLAKKYADELGEELLVEKITDMKAYYNSPRNKDRFDNIKMSEKDFFRLADVDPTHRKDSKGAGTYLEWLLRLITSGKTTFKDIINAEHEYRDQLDAFDDLKKRNRLPADKKDIMRVDDLRALMHLVATRGSDEEEPSGNSDEPQEVQPANTMSDFKQDLKDFPALCQKLGWPDSVTDSADEHLEFVGENGTWEVWKIKSPLGCYIFDRWGAGAKWCVGGSGLSGEEGKRQANRHYPNYLNGGKGCYVCFQKKDRSATRPYNKALITFDDETRYKESQFNHANNETYYSDSYYADTVSEFARFLSEEGLLNVLKGTEFGNCESIKDAEIAERLQNGEPYIYAGEKIKDDFKPLIKTIVFEDNYNKTIKTNIDNTYQDTVGIPNRAFSGCVNLERVDMPSTIVGIGYNAFTGCDKVKIYTPNHHMVCYPKDIDFLVQHMVEVE